MATVVGFIEAMARLLRRIGPLVIVELLLPGGTLIALLLLLSRTGRLHFAGRTMTDMMTRKPALVRVAGERLSVVNVIS